MDLVDVESGITVEAVERPGDLHGNLRVH